MDISQRQQLENAIAALEAQRAILGDAAVEAAIAGLRQQLGTLQPSPPPSASEARLAPAAGERKLVTIVFADIAGFTALAEGMDPEAVRDLMNTCFAQLTPIIEKYGGTVDKFVGDAIMALFGAPVTHENDAERALRAAIEMMDALNSFKALQAATAQLGLHIGINTGHVVAGSIGTRGQQAYSVIGDAVNTAARLEDLSQAGEILVGGDTYRLTAPLFEFEARPVAHVKGKAEPVQVYRLLAARAVAGKLRGIAGLDSPLVGREAEFQALQATIARLETGTGGVVTLVGEAGLGKSRLVAETKKLWASKTSQLNWVEGRCLSYGGSIAYLLWLDTLRSLLGVAPDAAPPTVEDTLREQAHALCDDCFDDTFPYLARLLSLPLPAESEARLHGLGAQGLKRATFQAVGTLLGRAAQQCPLVLVCEDLHWADPTSLELLEQVLSLVDMSPLLIIGVMRPEREHGCWRFKQATAGCEHSLDLPLSPLSPDQSEALVSNLLRVQALPPALCQRILKHAEGNPFFVEEIIRSLMDSGAIVYEPASGRWRATREVDEIVIPDTLQGVLAARIDRLQSDTKRILQMAAVVGRVFFYRVLQAIAAAEKELDAHLLTLQQQEMIRERAHVPELEYIFKHQLTQEAAYNGLLKQERRIFHRQVAEVLERLFPDRIDEQVGLLAHHWQRAEVAEKAIPYLLRAGSQSVAAYTNEEAIEYLQQALKLLDEYAGAERQAWQLEAWSRLGQAYHAAGRLVEAEDCFRKATALGQEMGITPHELVRLYYWLCDVLWWQGRYEDVIRQSEDGLALLGKDSESVEAAMMYKHLGGGYVIIGEQRKGLECARNIEHFLSGLPYEPEIRSAYTDVALEHRWRGDVEGALVWLQRLEELAIPYHDLRALGEVHHWRGGVLFDTGDLRGAMLEYSQAMEIFTRIGDIRHIGMLQADEAGVRLSMGDLESARHCADSAIKAVTDAWNLTRTYIQAGYAFLCQGATDDALETFQKAAQFAPGGNLWYKAELACAFGQICLIQRKHAEAFRHFERILTDPGLEWLSQQPYWLNRVLDGLEQSTDPETFFALCRRLGQEPAGRELPQCFLAPAELRSAGEPVFQDDFTSPATGWTWVDPLGDCSYVAQAGLEIRASNGRNLLWANQSAPRLVRAVEGDWTAQVACNAVSRSLPAAGGLLLWKDRQNYLRLDVGQLNRQALALVACLAGQNMLLGRGRLPLGFETQVWLRLERAGDQVRALCSQDGHQWFGVGQVAFPAQDPVQIGVCAIGNIDRAVYHGAYPDGTAIRFMAFRLAAT